MSLGLGVSLGLRGLGVWAVHMWLSRSHALTKALREPVPVFMLLETVRSVT